MLVYIIKHNNQEYHWVQNFQRPSKNEDQKNIRTTKKNGTYTKGKSKSISMTKNKFTQMLANPTKIVIKEKIQLKVVHVIAILCLSLKYNHQQNPQNSPNPLKIRCLPTSLYLNSIQYQHLYQIKWVMNIIINSFRPSQVPKAS